MSKKIKYEFINNGEKITHIVEEKPTQTKEMPTNKKSKLDEEPRDRKFSLVSYIDEGKLYTFLKRAEWIQHFAFCTHDLDVWTAEDEKKNPEHKAGTPKGKHTHIVIYTYNAKTSSAVKKNFDRYSREVYRDTDIAPQNTTSQICFDMVSQWRYLVHADDDDKYQYDKHTRICDNFSYWNKLELSAGMNDTRDNTGLAMLTDYMNGVHPLEMAHRYGKEYIYHIKSYQNFAYEIAKADARSKVNSLPIREMMQLCLDGSPISAEMITNFWVVYEYIISQINHNYNSQIEFYLTENEVTNA